MTPIPTTTRAVVTTSWDDGHPSDERLCELLLEYGIAATLYIPRRSQRPVMSESVIRALAENFEIGAHTLDHLALTTLPAQEAQRQIIDSKKWVEDVTGRPCRMFCPPLGKFDRSHHNMIREAGFLGYRTVEMLRVDRPRPDKGLIQMPTTLQAHPHAKSAYIKNAVKRRSVTALGRALRYQSGNDWLQNVPTLIESAQRTTGVFHLWGHSWELDENEQWPNLKRALTMVRHHLDQHSLTSTTNARLCSESD